MNKTGNIWILLADTRKKLLWLWIAFAGLIFALFLFMTVVNTFEDVEVVAWVWALGNLLLPLALLFIGVILNPHPSKVVKKSTFWLIYYSALSYLLLILITLIGMQAWLDSHTDQGIAAYFQQSYLWILPFQTLLLLGIWVLYFQNRRPIQADEKIVLGYAQKKAEYAHRFSNVKQQTAFDYLVQNDFTNLFEFLKTAFNGDSDQKEVILLQAQYNKMQETIAFNTDDPATVRRELNRVSMALIDIIEKL